MSDTIADTLRTSGGLIEALTRSACATEQLSKEMGRLAERIEKLERAVHTPPCQHAKALDVRVSTLEKTSGRATDLIWKLIAVGATAACAALWKLGQ